MITKKGIMRKVRKGIAKEHAREPLDVMVGGIRYVPVAGELHPLPGSRSRETFGGPKGAGFSISVRSWLNRITRNSHTTDRGMVAKILGVSVSDLPQYLRDHGFGY